MYPDNSTPPVPLSSDIFLMTPYHHYRHLGMP
jgi:hypothetical protein